MSDQSAYAGRAQFIYGDPPKGYDSPEQALKERDATIERLKKQHEVFIAAHNVSGEGQLWRIRAESAEAALDQAIAQVSAEGRPTEIKHTPLASIITAVEVADALLTGLNLAGRLPTTPEEKICPQDGKVCWVACDGRCELGLIAAVRAEYQRPTDRPTRATLDTAGYVFFHSETGIRGRRLTHEEQLIVEAGRLLTQSI